MMRIVALVMMSIAISTAATLFAKWASTHFSAFAAHDPEQV